MNIADRLKELNLPDNSFVVVGSGILNALGIRDSGDIDLIVSEDIYNRFDAAGWDHDTWSDQTVLKKDVFDLGKTWYGKSVEDLIKRAQYIDGVPYLSLDDVYEWKKILGREKDINDLKLIEEFRKPIQRFSAGGVIYKDGKVLTIKWLSKDSIEFPKGNVEPGEQHSEAATREVFEETGYQAKIIQSIGDITFEFDWDDGKRYRKTVNYFLMELVSDNEPTPKREENEDFENYWITVDEAEKLLTHDDSKEILHRAIEAIRL